MSEKKTVWLTEDYDGLWAGTAVHVESETEDEYTGTSTFMATTFEVTVPKSICTDKEQEKELPLGRNYTNPDDENHHDTPEQWLGSSLIFARALGMILEPDTGIVVDSVGDVQLIVPGVKKFIVANMENQIKVLECDEDYEEGSYLKLVDEEDKKEEE